jgi:PAS domain S-box-containing protein
MSCNIRDILDLEPCKYGCYFGQNQTCGSSKFGTVKRRYTRKDGTTFWGLFVGFKIGDIPNFGNLNVILIREISDRKQIEEKVRHHHDLREAIFTESIDAIFIVDSDTLRTLDLNPRAVELFQASSREELIDIEVHSLQKRQFTPPEMEHIVREIDEKGSWSYELEYITKKGDEFWVNLAVKRLYFADQKLNIVRMMDITDRKRFEQIKDESISTVSHELRTPLTSIYASLSLLNSGWYESQPEKQKQMLAVATRETDRLVRLVNDVLDIERLASGKAELEKSICNVGELIEQSIDGIQSLAEQKQIAIIRHWSTTSIWANSDAIVQILINLLSNAIKFSPPESILKISTSIQDDNVLFRVQDRGCGIPQEQLEHIFQPFKQVKGAGRHPKGTGLGLAISQKLVHQHGGKIWAESVVGEGSTFSFTIPHSNSKSTARPPC